MTMNIKKPNLRYKLDKVDDLQNIFKVEASISQIHGIHQTIISIKTNALSIKESKMDNIVMQDVELRDCILDDIIFFKNDLSGLKVPKLAADRIEFISCRMSGVQMYESTLKEVIFKDTKLDLANFRFSKLKNVVFEDCILDEADFAGVEFNNIKFINCELDRVDFSNTKIVKLDLRTSNLLNIKGISSLKGAIISPTQLITISPQIAAEIGLTVKD